LDVIDRLLLAVEDVHLLRSHGGLGHSSHAQSFDVLVVGRDGTVRLGADLKGVGDRYGHRRHGLFLGVTGVYHRRSKRRRKMTAIKFISIKKLSKTTIAADVRSANARSGLSDQRKICTGNAVAGSVKPSGTSTKNATIPIINSGAVSPNAWAIPIIAPVSMS